MPEYQAEGRKVGIGGGIDQSASSMW